MEHRTDSERAASLCAMFRRKHEPGKHEPVPLTLYTRPGCQLCDEMKAELARAGLEGGYTLREVNIDDDPALTAAHGRSIPVLALGERALFKGRATAAELRTKIERVAREVLETLEERAEQT